MISKPQPGEYAPWSERYIAKVPNGPILEILEYLRDSTYNFFSRMTAEQADFAYAEGKWTIKEMLAHIIDTERIFAFRAFCFSRGEQQPLPGFDQDDYMRHANIEFRTIQDLANEFKAVRESSLYIFNSLSDEQAMLIGTASNHPMSVRALVYMTAGHELHHLDILKERYIK
jgi:uncharacterized damage-inducible protein DinB